MPSRSLFIKVPYSFLLLLFFSSSCSTTSDPTNGETESLQTETVLTEPSEQPLEKEDTELERNGSGQSIFGLDQIITIELVFSDENFFNTLLSNNKTSEYIAASLTINDTNGTHHYENVGVRLKGNSSMAHPGEKKPFKIDFNKYMVGQNHDGLTKINFSNAFKDPSFLREKVFFDASRSAGVLAPRTNFANVYFNGELWGLYTVVEQIDDQFLDWNIGNDDGNMFKAGSNGSADLKYLGPNQNTYEDVYEIKNNEDTNNWADLISLIDFINNSSPEEFEDGLGKYLDIEMYLRSAALDNLFSNLDSYTYSGRNYYLYHNTNTGLWQWIKWDGNEAFGSYAYGVRESVTELPVTFSGSNKPLLQRIFDSEKLTEKYLGEVCILLSTVFTPDYLLPVIDELTTLIQSSVYADEKKMYSDEEFLTNINTDIMTENLFMKEMGKPSERDEKGSPRNGQLPNREEMPIFGLKSFIEQKHSFLGRTLDCGNR
jgi:hypothetical protein